MKSIFQSKTFWFNFLTIVTAFASVYGYVPNQELAENASGVLLVLAPIINIVLRWFTTKPVSLTGKL